VDPEEQLRILMQLDLMAEEELRTQAQLG